MKSDGEGIWLIILGRILFLRSLHQDSIMYRIYYLRWITTQNEIQKTKNTGKLSTANGLNIIHNWQSWDSNQWQYKTEDIEEYIKQMV